jgi:hypothetical protein
MTVCFYSAVTLVLTLHAYVKHQLTYLELFDASRPAIIKSADCLGDNLVT